MPSPRDTAYPVLKACPSDKELQEIYTPTVEEIAFARRKTRLPAQFFSVLLLLKTFQRLGYFVKHEDIPLPILRHISQSTGSKEIPDGMESLNSGTARDRVTSMIREYLGVTVYGPAARRVVVDTCLLAARTRDDLPDIINMAIEELIRQRYELPAFSTLLKIARTTRNALNRDYQTRVYDSLDMVSRQRLLSILNRPEAECRSLWDQVKREPKRSTVHQMKDFLDHLHWLRQQNVPLDAFAGIPEAKIRHFAAEARSLDLASLNDMPLRKRLVLTAALILKQTARALDDVANMYSRQVNRMHGKAKEALSKFREASADRVDALIARLHDITRAYKAEGPRDERLAVVETLLEKDADQILEQCAAHGAVAANDHLAFLPAFYAGRRSTLYLFLESVSIVPTTQEHPLSSAIAFLLENKGARGEWLVLERSSSAADGTVLSDLSFIPDKWWPLVTGKKERTAEVSRVDRRYFELCVFSQVEAELKSGDLCIPGSDQFSDYRMELIPEDEYKRGLALYGEQAGIPVEPAVFIRQLRQKLEDAAKVADDSFPDNEYLKIENGEPVLKRLRKKPEPSSLRRVEQLLTDRMEAVDIIDALSDTEHWLNWTRFFGPISGHDAKLANPRERYVITTFCYGCNLGPTQTARSIKGLDRRQVSFTNQRHVTEEKLNQAITEVVNAYARFPLQRLWGQGKSASADGTKWDMYAQNLVSEYHIRYGGYGGLGYYMVADSYIALFSRFSTCGSWEGHYILDFIEENKSDVRPDKLHADTQGQSTAIFGLSYLLGIELMPRIRNWKDLNLCRPSDAHRYAHIDSLFTTQVDWDLIETMLPDMLRVVLSIKAGTIMPSTILRRLATYSRKNKLYLALRELGRVIRTIFLLKYLSDVELRRTIQAATNKSEAFNRFVQWVCFGGDGVIAETSGMSSGNLSSTITSSRTCLRSTRSQR